MAEQEVQEAAPTEETVETEPTMEDTSVKEPEVNEGEAPMRSLDFILDLPLKVSVELGRTRMLVNDLLQLAQGSIIELEKMAGDPLEILVNEKLVARGEVVSVNDKFGIRVTDIISPTERIEQLG
ncbi:MAG: flagellar motor switch protein FliN [Deltaproteobacteria bacterium]|nr:flagellar motor switch protein FliN [Deltaproteobacteria bacterium]